MGRGLVLFQEVRVGVLECKEPGQGGRMQRGAGGGRAVHRGVVTAVEAGVGVSEGRGMI